ncbi:hypothetical protein FB567DRAFT_583283 [Paraphoma chrysanthemicola]|uniref:Uncharacterized protein n=1 Tax=Paraphoma chrysanthemicola TaxID=798071 RepID=A0A8K0QYJ5_9PLEO|nr:hypothetical protein FB567DRAFT_583283 [Paraphoma chrysanthemicola]
MSNKIISLGIRILPSKPTEAFELLRWMNYLWTFPRRYSDSSFSNRHVPRLRSILNTTQLLQRTAPTGDEDSRINGAVNSLNNYRQGDETETPLEFVYEAADCRLFYTRESYLNPVVLWTQAIEAKWGNGSCVPGSTGDKTAIGVINKTPFELKGKNSTNNSSTPVNEGGASGSIARSGFLTLAAVFAVGIGL